MPHSSDNLFQDQALKYPPVHIDRSLSTLDLDTLMMRSTTPREESRNPLDESNYEIVGLSDSMMELTSDDEAHTESIASTDGPTPDDASDFSDDDNEYGAVHRELENSISSAHATAHNHPFNAHTRLTTEDSTHTEVPAYTESSEDAHQMRLKLNEQPGEDLGIVQGSQVVREFTEGSSAWFPVFDQYKCSEVRLVVKGGMSQETVLTPDSYRIWYIGEPDRWLENKISSQIAAALTACPNNSRSVMVQGQLEPYGPIMNTQWCTNIHVTKGNAEPSHLTFTFENGSEITVGSGNTIMPEECPDLVVLNYPTTPMSATNKQDYVSACKILQREKIPYLELVAARRYGHGSMQYDSRSLVACVEGRNDPKADFKLQEVLLLDHFTFCELDPTQLNRHLALISPKLLASQAPAAGKVSRTSNTWKEYVKRVPIYRYAGMKMLLMVLALTGMLAAYILNPLFISLLTTTPPNIGHQPAISISQLTSPQIITSSVVTTPTVVVATPSSVKMVPNELTVVPPPSKSARQKQGKCKHKVPIGFHIQTTSDYRFELSPAKNFSNVRKKPQLQIQVFHNQEAVPIRFNRTTSGLYVVDLEREYPFGLFNVSIASFSKPLFQQSFDVMLGHNKSSIAQLFDTARSHFEDVQNSLLSLSERVAVGVDDMGTKARKLSHKAQEFDDHVLSHFHEAKSRVDRQVRAGTIILKRLPGIAWTSAKSTTAPLRTSKHMLKARTNALRMRCQLELATGLSSEDVGAKQSWACSKVKG